MFCLSRASEPHEMFAAHTLEKTLTLPTESIENRSEPGIKIRNLPALLSISHCVIAPAASNIALGVPLLTPNLTLFTLRAASETSTPTCRPFGLVVPMPTFVSAFEPFTPLMLPGTRLLLCVTDALAPIVVAFVIPEAPFDALPMNVLLSSEVLDKPALWPKKELLLPPELFDPASLPKNEFAAPK